MSDKMAVGQFFGKYRGTVVNNADPLQRGRLLVQVPDVLGLVPSSWAEACVPLAGPTGPAMGVYMVPPNGAGVWVEFEQGDPSHPIWVGCRWGGASDIPPIAHAGVPLAPNIVMQTLGQNSLVLSDSPDPTGGIMLKSRNGVNLVVNDTGIYIRNGQASIQVTAGAVLINGQNLVVTV
jgi:uncharacterized protein involved in type VI secretion and phage assembly